MDLKDNLRILESIASIADKISFSGGEVLLYDGFDILLNKAKELDVQCSFTTNGTNLNKNNFAKYLNCVGDTTFSLDFISDEKNKLLNRGSNYFNKRELIHIVKLKNNFDLVGLFLYLM